MGLRAWIPLPKTVLALASLAACGEPEASPNSDLPPAGAEGGPSVEISAAGTPATYAATNGTPAATTGTAVLVGAGDIASCDSDADEATAALLDGIPGLVFTAGDHVYPAGTLENFRRCYEPSWGRHKERTRPAVGDHDIREGLGYYRYFGAAAGEVGRGYYSLRHGAWKVVVLNATEGGGVDPEQLRWASEELAADSAGCSLVVTHTPRFSSGHHGSHLELTALWSALYRLGVEVVLSGHDHHYERFAPQDAHGRLDTARGVRQFVVGTGGAEPREVRTALPNSETRRGEVAGVLRLELRPDSYAWDFIPAPPHSYRDQGSDVCH